MLCGEPVTETVRGGPRGLPVDLSRGTGSPAGIEISFGRDLPHEVDGLAHPFGDVHIGWWTDECAILAMIELTLNKYRESAQDLYE